MAKLKEKIFKIGDKVRFRSWEDMEEEFGLCDSGAIDCKFKFNKEGMKRDLCGLVGYIHRIDSDGEIYLKDKDGNGIAGRWKISGDMLEFANRDESNW